MRYGFANRITSWIEAVRCIHRFQTRTIGIAVVVNKRHRTQVVSACVVRGPVEVGGRKCLSSDVVPARNSKVIDDYIRFQIVPDAGEKTEILLVRPTDVMPILPVAGVVEL